MKMAKAQKATLDPSKISGRCGRLMCCLRYEDRVYDELKKQLPRKGATVVIERGKAEVIDYDIISQTLRVETREGRILKVSMKDVKEVIPRDDREYQKKQQARAQKRGGGRGRADRGGASSGGGDAQGSSRRSRGGRRRGGRGRRPRSSGSNGGNAAEGKDASDRSNGSASNASGSQGDQQ
jgi:hypothetical protein